MKNYKTDTRADYAEFFEAILEFSTEKIPRGTSVVLVGEKIRPAVDKEIPFGVISSTPIMLGSSGAMDGGKSWGGKYLLDEFGNFITEKKIWWSKTITKIKRTETGNKEVSKRINGWAEDRTPLAGATLREVDRAIINPEYDELKQFIPRKERLEWNMVGLLGKIKILKNQPTNPNWIKLKDVNERVEEWLVR
jgi:hypothetical protein